MNIVRVFLTVALALLSLAPLLAQVRPSASAPEWVYVPAPPEVVAGAGVTQARWSPDGQYALAVRFKITLHSLEERNPALEPSLSLWNAARRTSTVLWRVESPDYFIGEPAWLLGTSVAFVTVAHIEAEKTTTSLWRVDARRATISEITGAPGADGVSV